jgi:pSer/pThr/pTyr-binding forkhead associated (FHA) protein
VIGSCGACGAMLAPDVARCGRCEAPVVGPRPATTSLLASLAPASGGDQTLTAAVDVALVVLAAVPIALGAADIWPPAVGIPFGLVLVTGVVVLLLREFRRTGGTPGALLTRTRYVDALVGTPPGPGRWPGNRVATVSVGERRPAPPAAPTARTVLAGAPTAASTTTQPPATVSTLTMSTPTSPRRPVAPQAPRLPAAVLTDGTDRIEVASTVLLGRRPRPRPSEEVGAVVHLADPTRSVSSTHALLSWDGETLWLVDRGSTNGSWVVRADGEREHARAGVAIAAPAGSTVQLGNRSFRVEES